MDGLGDAAKPGRPRKVDAKVEAAFVELLAHPPQLESCCGSTLKYRWLARADYADFTTLTKVVTNILNIGKPSNSFRGMALRDRLCIL